MPSPLFCLLVSENNNLLRCSQLQLLLETGILIEKLSKLLTVLTHVTTAAIIWCLTLSEQNLLSPRSTLILVTAMNIPQLTFIDYYGKTILSLSAFSLVVIYLLLVRI